VISRKSRASNTLEVQELAVFEPKTGKWLAGALSMSLARGDRKVMIGPSGAGKTSLVRALGGVWPYGTGEIRIPTGASMLVLPQQVYIPIGTLENALAYPNDVQAYPKHHYAEILIAVGLQGLVDQIEVEATWQERLSGGERQRIAIARALLSMPDFLILDEATSALDEASEAAILDLMEGRLPNTAILMVAHRSSVIRRYVDVVEVRRPVHDMVLDAPDRGDASPSHEPGVQAVPAF
jgi:putative ATP-binding cassette transporter